MSREELLEAWGDTYGHPDLVVETTVIDDGERLASFGDGTVDFVIANHLLEHTEDPIAALESWVRVTRPGGVILITLPDARHTFDSVRPRTTVEHVIADHSDGPGRSREAHYAEWAETVERLPAEDVPRRVQELAAAKRREHFHVWELEGFLELLGALDLPVRLEVAQAIAPEFSVVLRRREG
jgi:SAM-dependent methyltransferase